jgi:transposase-like protein
MEDMNTESNEPKTLQQAIKFFADYSNAHAFMVQIRWGGGPVCCPTCGSVRIRYIQTRRQWECREKHPKRRFSLKTGTIMEDSPLPLEKWLAAYWYEANCKNSISSYEIHRELGVTQKTAWFMLHRIRFAIKQRSFAMMGRNGVPVEADETYIGGKSEFMHAKERERRIIGRGQGGKTVVMGLLERHGGKKNSTVRTMVLPRHPSQSDMHGIIHKHVEPGAHLMTDDHAAYKQLYGDFEHHFVDHATKYAEGIVHTNGLENFWSLFKRCIKGTHVSVDPQHLAAYLDSEAFRFNHRKLDNAGRFNLVANQIKGKRLTYKALIGASEGYTSSHFGF